MEPERRCPACGQAIPWGETRCPFCSERRGYLWLLRRETFLVLIFTLLVLLFVITGFAVRSYHRVERGLAQDWYSRGEGELKAGHREAALADFRNALFYWQDNALYRLRLAQALVATGHLQQASAYLLNLREREPGNGTVNLELARLAVRQHAVPEALRYFQDAIYGEWDNDSVVRRRAVRLELVEFLLDSDQRAAARAELIALATNLPPDAKLQTQVGTLLMEVAGYDDALRVFRQALAVDPHLAPALAGAGECYFQMGHYVEAQRYLTRAVQQDPHLTRAAGMLRTAEAVVNLDPFYRRLSNQERARRAGEAFDEAMMRLEACAAQRRMDLKAPTGDPLQTLNAQATALRPRVRPRNLSRDSDLLSNTMDLVFEIEKAASQACGEPQGLDLALLLIAREQEGARP
jgi:tetratricopeptide (TPR) repeat protein/predicted nucleic acid-binding Zn ribbon protein